MNVSKVSFFLLYTLATLLVPWSLGRLAVKAKLYQIDGGSSSGQSTQWNRSFFMMADHVMMHFALLWVIISFCGFWTLRWYLLPKEKQLFPDRIVNNATFNSEFIMRQFII